MPELMQLAWTRNICHESSGTDHIRDMCHVIFPLALLPFAVEASRRKICQENGAPQTERLVILQEAQLLPSIIQCMDEDYYAETRVMACHALHAGLLLAGVHLSVPQLRTVYPEILKRLDDSSNDVRCEVCKVAVAWGMALPPR